MAEPLDYELGVKRVEITTSTIPYTQPVPFGALNSAGNGVDVWRNNTEGTAISLAARTSTFSSPVQRNYNARGVTLYLRVTANPGGTDYLTLYFYDYDVIGGLGSPWIASIQIPAATNGLFTLQIAPGSTTALGNSSMNKSIAYAVPANWNAAVIPSVIGNSWTYAVEYAYTL